jgi:hypothetical protein
MFDIKKNLGKIIIILLVLLIIIHVYTEKEHFEVTTSSFSWLYNLPGLGWIKIWIDALHVFNFITYIPIVGPLSYGSTICCSLILPLVLIIGSLGFIIKFFKSNK